MKTRTFKTYSPLLCLKINVVTALILLLLFSCSTLFLTSFERDTFELVHSLALDNGNGAMVAIVVVSGVVGILLMSYSILIPFFIPIFNNYKDNLKSLIGVVLCNAAISLVFYLHITPQLAMCYFLLTCIGALYSMYLNYLNRK